MAQKFEWPIYTRSLARNRRLKAIAIVSWMLPQPYNFNSHVGFGLRRMRLENELAEYDLLHRLRCGCAASLEELVRAGSLLITSRKDRFPAQVLPLDEELLINPKSFDLVAGWAEDRLRIRD